MIINVYTNEIYLKSLLSEISDGIHVHVISTFADLYKKGIHTLNNLLLMALDVYFDEDILDIAKLFKAKQQDIQIIFIQDSSSFNAHIYDIDHCYSMTREQTSSHLAIGVKKAVESLSKNSLVLSNNKRIVTIDTNQIRYIERKGLERKTYVYTHNMGAFICDAQIESFMERLSCKAFIQCHNSFIVPIKDIVTIEKTQLMLKEKTFIPVSRSHLQKLKELFVIKANLKN